MIDMNTGATLEPSNVYMTPLLHYPHGANAGCDLAGVAA